MSRPILGIDDDDLDPADLDWLERYHRWCLVAAIFGAGLVGALYGFVTIARAADAAVAAALLP